MKRGLAIVSLLGNICVLKQRAKLGGQRKLQRNCEICTDSHSEVSRFFRGFGNVKQGHILREIVFCILRGGRLCIERKRKTRLSRGGVEGNGLGLWIAQQIAVAHGGDLRAENAPAGGAVFLLTLPFNRKE